jgi:hypothetical protein
MARGTDTDAAPGAPEGYSRPTADPQPSPWEWVFMPRTYRSLHSPGSAQLGGYHIGLGIRRRGIAMEARYSLFWRAGAPTPIK